MDIEPCPTCSATDCRIGSDGYVDANLRPAYFVVCDSMACNLIGPNKPTKEQAIIDWNRLSRAARLLTAVERLEETTNPINLSYLLDTWYSAHAGFLAPSLVDALIALGEVTG